jgi:uncharacterized protein (DUF58 family)
VNVDFLDPKALAQIGGLELIAQHVVDGFLSGKHRSTHKGGCFEFAEYRRYAPGDDLRMLDWRRYARSDRYYVKRFEDETNMQVLLVVDASGSMRFGRSTVSKWEYARLGAACLARLLMRQRDSAGLAVVSQGVDNYVRPVARASHLARLFSTLSATKPQGESDLPAALTRLVGRVNRRGIVILFSDCFGDIGSLVHALNQFRCRGHEVLVFQTLAPEELSFPFTHSSEFRDLESTRKLHIQPAEIRRRYLERFGAFQRELAADLTGIGCDHVILTTNEELGQALSRYLIKRAAVKIAHRPFAKP